MKPHQRGQGMVETVRNTSDRGSESIRNKDRMVQIYKKKGYRIYPPCNIIMCLQDATGFGSELSRESGGCLCNMIDIVILSTRLST